MGIKSTVHVPRSYALSRIAEIDSLAIQKKYKLLEDVCFEPDIKVKDFVDNYIPIDTDLNDWTNEMLGNKLDEPYFRNSMFDNYIVYDN